MAKLKQRETNKLALQTLLAGVNDADFYFLFGEEAIMLADSEREEHHNDKVMEKAKQNAINKLKRLIGE